ncbi:hypothetical protein QCA50_000791 [Cerrena zonata]|uniref:Uncharacterized protein n=1 Tax=Cerrena zonata TaxID=2478898 RepID=A0AAW0GXW4_9APHY
MTTRTLTFKSSDLGENIDLVLCFATPDVSTTTSGSRADIHGVPAKQYPVVWKTTTLTAQGHSQLSATFVNAPGFSTVQINGRKVVSPANYVPIQVGQETTLNVENNVRPPVFYFSDPTSIAGDIVKATNVTGQTVNIGLGFIADAESPTETMVPTTIFRNVPSGHAISDAFTPVLRAYVNIGSYAEGQLIDRDLANVQPIWEANLFGLQPSTTIILQASMLPARPVKQVQTRIQPITIQPAATVTEVVELRLPAPKVEVINEEREKVYSPILAFTLAENVVQGVKHIAEHLIGKSYKVKFTYTEGSTEAALSLTLPSNTSCEQAEQELLSVIETYIINNPLSPKLNGSFTNGHSNGLDQGINGSSFRSQTRISIKSRSASQMVSAGDNFSYWVEINPSSNEWLSGSSHHLHGVNGNNIYPKNSTYPHARANSTQGYLTAVSNILENVNNGLNGLSVQNQTNGLGVSVTKNRPLSRKSSTVGLGSVAVY